MAEHNVVGSFLVETSICITGRELDDILGVLNTPYMVLCKVVSIENYFFSVCVF